MNKQSLKGAGGFTFLEFLIYIAIISIILLVAANISLNVLFGKAKLMAMEEVSQNTRFVMEKITDRISRAESINSPIEGSSSTILSLEMANSTEDPTIFDLSGGIVRIKEGTGATAALTSSEVSITNLQFYNISYEDTPGTVRIQMTIKLVNPENRQEYNFEKTFYTSFNIREK